MAKKKFEDDGRTIANMNCDGFRWYKPPKEEEKKKEIDDLGLTKKEKRALVRQAFKQAIPSIGIIVASLLLAMLLVSLWLR